MKKNFNYFPIPVFFLFIIFFSCQKELHFDNVTSNVGGSAVFTLQGSPSACMNASIYGNYIKIFVLATTNKVNVDINVTTAGSYTISTNTVNGYKFSASGTLTTTGIQTISLAASGTPLIEGINVFTITAGSSSCTFSVTVTGPPPVVQGNHFPLTTNSFWIYDDLFNPGDTVKRTVIDSVHTNGYLYKVFEEKKMFGNPDQYFFRRDDSVYYEYGSVDKYTVSFKFLPAIKADIPFLREYLVTGATWKSDEFIGTATFGQTLFLQYNFSCEDANATVTINGKTFSNVYKITMLPQIRSAITYPYSSTGEIRDFYFAKDIGLIYTKATNNSFTLLELQLKNCLVN